MATPYISGLAAVLFGYSNNAAAVRNQIGTTALDVPPLGLDIYTGAGLIQMDAAIRQALSPTAEVTQATSSGNPNQLGQPGGQVQFFATATPTWTQTLLSTITVVSVTRTLSATPASTPSALPAEAATQFATTTPELTAQGQELDFRSPYFYCGVILLLLGILTLILLARNRSSRRYSGW